MPRPKLLPNQDYTFTLRRDVGKQSLTQYISTRLGISEEWVLRFMQAGRVSIDGLTVCENEIRILEKGCSFCIAIPDGWPPHMKQTPMDLSILYEDEYMVVLDKPPGIVVHPARGHMTGNTLQNGLLHRYREERGAADSTIGPCHRIDRDTSGIAVFSRKRDAYRDLTRQFADHGAVQKTYLAIVDGAPAWQTTHCDEPLLEDPEDDARAKVTPIAEGGKEAHTDFTLIERGEGWALIEARPRTGRGHQIRVHLATLGFPIHADPCYHPDPEHPELARQALHAHKLALTHPIHKTRLEIVSPLPEDLVHMLAHLRG